MSRSRFRLDPINQVILMIMVLGFAGAFLMPYVLPTVNAWLESSSRIITHENPELLNK